MSGYYQDKLKFGAAVLVAAIPGGALLFLLQGICGFNELWTWYVSGLVFYTVLVFGNAYFEDDSILFSPEDHRSKLRLVAVHCICLLLLFALIQLGLYIQPLFSPSILSGSSKRKSWLEFLFFALLMAVFFAEENWLAAGRKKPGHKGE